MDVSVRALSVASATGTLAPAMSNGAPLSSKTPTGQASLFSSSSAGFGAQSDLTTAQLMHAAKMARLSGFTYRPVEDLSDWLSKEGLQLVARGQTHFTRWFVADGRADGLEEASTSGRELKGGAARIGRPEELFGSSQKRKRPARHRVIMLRGVAWRAGEFNARLWQDMIKFLPASFEGNLTQPRNALVAHSGMSDMAQMLFHELRPFLVEAQAANLPVTLGGHSLGGAFALLMLCMARVRLDYDPNAIKCYAFGAPPVLSLSEKTAAQNCMSLLNLPPGTVRSFVLDNDPVPRAMLSVDPTFAMLKQSAPMSWVLEARRAFLGSNVSFTPEKFLYENVGDVYLIKWTAESGQKVIPLAPAEMDDQLRLAVEELFKAPVKLIQALLDHSHGSYSQELYAAARQLERRHQEESHPAGAPVELSAVLSLKVAA
ncbi:g8288 [Coccomyxa viridis]|uniref:sn-1-specific diacylglycerol lipase n=1 Tax=Coccomyxa viridis TaxID=1274662 RepID=A0ABP1G6Q8_9CHLO